MPKPTKLHVKGKSKTIQKPCSDDKMRSSSDDCSEHEIAVRQFELELCWCIQQLERTLQLKKGSEKNIQDTWKVLQVLKNNNQPIIRKRQLMRSYFGDYRAKMLSEEKKLAKMASKMKICEKPDPPKATFLRKSAFLSTGDNSFRFNFNLDPEQIDNGNTSNTNTEASGNTSTSGNVGKTAESAASTVEQNVQAEVNPTKFKFTFSGSEFRFNFDVDHS